MLRPGLISRSNVSPVRMRPLTTRTVPIESSSSPSLGCKLVASVSNTTKVSLRNRLVRLGAYRAAQLLDRRRQPDEPLAVGDREPAIDSGLRVHQAGQVGERSEEPAEKAKRRPDRGDNDELDRHGAVSRPAALHRPVPRPERVKAGEHREAGCYRNRGPHRSQFPPDRAFFPCKSKTDSPQKMRPHKIECGELRFHRNRIRSSGLPRRAIH